jgi:excinuclease ABC subunit B
MTDLFKVVSDYQPVGDQITAIEQLRQGFQDDGLSSQTLMGVTGSGKTFTMAHLIAKLNRPTLVLSHNKTLAAQLFGEFKGYFPNNNVHYFVSYYDYYQPEAYIPQRDIYIEKDASVNEEIDRLRLAATASLVTNPDTIVVASVSCIYGLGSPDNFVKGILNLTKGVKMEPRELCSKLVDILFTRNDVSCERGTFRRRGDTVEIFLPDQEAAIRVEFFGDEIERLRAINPISGETLKDHESWNIYPAKHYIVDEEIHKQARDNIANEMWQRVAELKRYGKLLEANRLEARTLYDLEMMHEIGYCSGVENYSRHFENRPPGSRPYTLMDYFPDDWLIVIDESHVTVPQIGGMSHGDRSRKQNLVDHGFRLPSALDNRPMNFEEFSEKCFRTLYVSATPGPHEKEICGDAMVEQVIRPTGLVDPVIEIYPRENQIKHLIEEIHRRIARKERTLITTLTKRMAENLSEYLSERDIQVQYLHSDIETVERIELLRSLREGSLDVLVGVNLLREGLDLPEVSLVAIMDADKEGFLRSTTSLIQIIGRSARHINATVHLYADKITPSMKQAIDETERRRVIQEKHNEENGITPQSIIKKIRSTLEEEIRQSRLADSIVPQDQEEKQIYKLEEEMLDAASDLDFEKASSLRNRIREISPDWVVDGKKVSAVHGKKRKKAKRKGRR